MPKISVIMPIYNSEKYVSDAINSLLNQTYSDIEIIAINDGSKDHSADVVSKIKDDRLVFVDDHENHGFLHTLNRCITMTKGEYIARLDDDDIAYPTRFEKQVTYMDEHPEVVLCGTHYDNLIDGKTESRNLPPIYTDEQFKFSLAFDNICIPHSSFMIRRDALLEHNIQYETYKQVPDYHMQTCLCEIGKVHFIRESLVGYRIHSSQSTAVRSNKMKVGEYDRARLWYLHRLNIDEVDRTVLCRAAVRGLKTKDDFVLFAQAMRRYANICGIKDTKEDRECISFILNSELQKQKRSIEIIKAYSDSTIKEMGVRKPNLKYAIKCFWGYDPNYIVSDYLETDDGSVDKHS